MLLYCSGVLHIALYPCLHGAVSLPNTHQLPDLNKNYHDNTDNNFTDYHYHWGPGGLLDFWNGGTPLPIWRFDI